MFHKLHNTESPIRAAGEPGRAMALTDVKQESYHLPRLCHILDTKTKKELSLRIKAI